MLDFILFLILLFCFFRFRSICDFIYNFLFFCYWKWKDFLSARRSGFKRGFDMYGVRVFCGRQGSGKTVSLCWYLHMIKKKYPDVLIYTNFAFDLADGRLDSLNDLLFYRNGDKGIIFAIDELQNEFSSKASRDFPETLLSTITMQRKQKICILATTQVFSRLAKPLREQCFQVIECRTFFRRWTRMRGYDADDYNMLIDNPDPKKRFKLHKNFKKSFIQSDKLRNSYDTYEVIERLSRQGFVEK